MKQGSCDTTIGLRRPISSYAKVRGLISTVIRNRAYFANTKAPGCYLDLGCGPNVDPEFCNLDYDWRPGIDICWDVTCGLPFKDGHVGGIFSEHMLEHLAFAHALALLKECRRVLRAGGILRVVVPDGQIYLSEYAKHLAGNAACMPYGEDDKSSFAIATPITSVNRIFSGHGHRFIWDYETLRLALFACGFGDVARRGFGEGRDPRLLRDTPSRRVESLYVEAS